jgi:iron-sulfur cluster repair protein YtfE (RIC family)
MASKGFGLDMTMMYAVHDAFRRELGRLARISARTDDDPQRVLSVAAGWEMLKTYLRVHDGSENDGLWPAMRLALAHSRDEAALVEAMEAEHAAIDPMLAAVDEALADPEAGPGRLAELIDGLASSVSAHLRHEEREGLPLIDSVLSEEEWQSFSEIHRQRIGAHVNRYLPWLLDGATEDKIAHILARVPQPARLACQSEWRAAYARLDLWGDGNGKEGGGHD